MMDVSVSSKFSIPPLPAGYVARPQLVEVFDSSRSCRLLLVSAQAGAGKTTLASAWAVVARKRGDLTCWLSVEAGDNDLRRFLEYLEISLEEGGATLSSAAAALRQAGAFAGGWLAASPGPDRAAGLVNGSSRLDRDVFLMIDDYHLVTNPEIHNALEALVDHMPPRLHLVLLTRSDPPLKLARLRVEGRLAEVRMEQLRFSIPETAAFLNHSAGLKLDDADIEALNHRAEGWIAGLQMAAIYLRGHPGDAHAFITAFAGSHRFVFDYLLEQVLDQQTSEMRQFLLRTSVLERLSAPLCQAVAQPSLPARTLLDSIERSNLFLIPLDDERGWYRYHHLFTDLLKVVLEQNEPGLFIELHRRACRWYESQDLLPEALHHALAAGDMELAARLVSSNVLLLIENDEAGPTLQKIDSLPAHILNSHPWLGIARAWVMGAGQVTKSKQALDHVEANLAQIADPAERQRLTAHLAAARVIVYGAEGDVENTFRYARQADALLPPGEISVRASILSVWGDIFSRDEHDPAALPILERALALALQAGKPHAALMASAALGSFYLGAGEFHSAQRVLQDALALSDRYQARTGRLLSAASSSYVLSARVFAEWGDTLKAIELGRKGLALSERWGQDDTESMCLLYVGQALMFSWRCEQAWQVLLRAQRLASQISPWLWGMAAGFCLDSLLDHPSPDPVEVQLQIGRVQESGERLPATIQSRLLLRDRQPHMALKLLQRALHELGGQPSMKVVRLHALLALAYADLGDEKAALSEIKTALELGSLENRQMTFLREGAPMEKLLRLARTRSIVPEFTGRLLAAFEARCKPREVQPLELLIEPLSERELEVLQHLNSHLSTPELAGLLYVSANTVRTHIKNIYGKLGVHGRSSAVRRAQELGLL